MTTYTAVLLAAALAVAVPWASLWAARAAGARRRWEFRYPGRPYPELANRTALPPAPARGGRPIAPSGYRGGRVAGPGTSTRWAPVGILWIRDMPTRSR